MIIFPFSCLIFMCMPAKVSFKALPDSVMTYSKCLASSNDLRYNGIWIFMFFGGER